MKKIFSYLKDYFLSVNKWMFCFATLFAAFAIYCNYHFKLNGRINRLNGISEYVAWYFIFLTAFGFGYLLQRTFLRSNIFSNKRFVQLLLLAPALFAWK